MADVDPQLKRLLLPDEETTFEQFIRYGLYIAAVFQIICLASLVFYPSGPSDGVAALKVLIYQNVWFIFIQIFIIFQISE